MIQFDKLWKIIDAQNDVTVLTYVPSEYDVCKIMYKLQAVFGKTLDSFQKFDERFEKIEDFDKILRASYNIDGNVLISAWLFEYDADKNVVTVDRQRNFRMIEKFGWVQRFTKTTLTAAWGWQGFSKHLIDWCNFAPGEYSLLNTSQIIELDIKRTA